MIRLYSTLELALGSYDIPRFDDLELIMKNAGKTFTKSDLEKYVSLMGDHPLDIHHVASILTVEQVDRSELYQVFKMLDKNGKNVPYIE